MTDDTPKRYAPYLAWRTFFNLILQLDEKGLPTRIDRSFLVGRSGVDQSYLIATMKAFGMISEDGTVLEPLKRLVVEKDVRPALVADVLKTNYPEVFSLASNATQSQLDDVFRDVYGLSGETLRKAQTFLLHAAAYGQLKLSPFFKTPRGVGAAGGQRKARRPRQSKAGASQGAPTAPVTSMVEPERTIRSDDAAEDMRLRYFDVLLKRVDSTPAGDVDDDLLDRIERLIGVEQSNPPRSAPRRTKSPRADARPTVEQGAADPPVAEVPVDAGTDDRPDVLS